MKTVARVSTVATWIRKIRCKGGHPVVFVPTMGALHGGHAALIRRARRLAGGRGTVVVSIFVNPTQFGTGEDFSRYPRTFSSDRLLCRREGVDLLFHPAASELYEKDCSVRVSEKSLSKGLCGASRPGHFDGVCTVVAILFQIIAPDIALFGEKDWQQLAVIRRMVRDLRMPVRIIGHPTVREKDGLALSSRNSLLSPQARVIAPGIRRALLSAARAAKIGETSAVLIRRRLLKDLAALPGARVDYAEIADPSTLLSIKELTPGIPARALVAVRFGPAPVVRLIDNEKVLVPE